MEIRAMQSAAIVILCVLAAIAYGITHDQFTARICVEYFTIGHPTIISSQNPTVLAFVWGVVATWWVGFGLGVPLAIAARAGSRPKIAAGRLVRPIATLLSIMAVCAATSAIIGWSLADRDIVAIPAGLADLVPTKKHVAFMAAWWAHSASYVVGLAGGLVVIIGVWRSRKRIVEQEDRE